MAHLDAFGPSRDWLRGGRRYFDTTARPRGQLVPERRPEAQQDRPLVPADRRRLVAVPGARFGIAADLAPSATRSLSQRRVLTGRLVLADTVPDTGFEGAIALFAASIRKSAMLVVTHRPSPAGWEYESQGHPNVQGFARTLPESLTSADHAVRHHLSSRSGYAVSPEDARHRVRHLVSGEAESGVPVAAAAH